MNAWRHARAQVVSIRRRQKLIFALIGVGTLAFIVVALQLWQWGRLTSGGSDGPPPVLDLEVPLREVLAADRLLPAGFEQPHIEQPPTEDRDSLSAQRSAKRTRISEMLERTRLERACS